MKRLAILGSTRGSSMQTIIESIEQGKLSAKIQMVISNKKDALILARASERGIRTQFIDPQGLTREQYDVRVSNVLKQNQIDLVLLIGYMRILSESFVTEWQNKIINIHPSLLPAYAGKMDLDVHHSVIAAGEKETGCTVHYVTAEVDKGPIIIQKKCKVELTDSPEILKTRVQALEGEALVQAIHQLSQ